MIDAALLENEDSELDRAQFDRAIQRAANDLQRTRSYSAICPGVRSSLQR
jgi:hypothetical protein